MAEMGYLYHETRRLEISYVRVLRTTTALYDSPVRMIISRITLTAAVPNTYVSECCE